MRVNTLDTVDSKAILQSAVSPFSPFFGSLTIKLSCQSRGILSVFQISLNRGYSMSVVVVISDLSSSEATLSGTCCLVVFELFNGRLDLIRGGFVCVYIGSSIGFSLNQGGFLAASLFRMRANCSAQRANCPSLSVIFSPLAFFTGLGWQRVLPLSSLVIM